MYPDIPFAWNAFCIIISTEKISLFATPLTFTAKSISSQDTKPIYKTLVSNKKNEHLKKTLPSLGGYMVSATARFLSI